MRRILLDVDGVVADFDSWYEDVARRTLGRDVSRVGVVEGFGHRYNMTGDEVSLVNAAMYGDPVIDIPFYPDATVAVRDLLRDDLLDVYFVTKPMVENPSWEFCRRMWFRDTFGAEAEDRLVFTGRKHVVCGDVFVDDNTTNVTGWLSEHAGCTGVVWETPYNSVQPPGAVRHRSWERLYDQVVEGVR